jgi:Domain of unknown function (DUF4279)
MARSINHSVATLRILGDDLLPDEISLLLGANPTESYKKGEELVGHSTGTSRIARTGRWSLSATRQEPEDLEAQIFEVLDQLSSDLKVWESISSRFKSDLFCGIFMGSRNEGVPLSSKALFAMGQRGISLGLDIHDASDNEPDVGP